MSDSTIDRGKCILVLSSNYLTVAAAEVRDELATYKRSSHAAHTAYLAAGAKLVEAREVAQRGEWGPFLAACGVESRTAQNMMQLARTGLSAEQVTDHGGVRGALESLRGPVQESEKSETVSLFSETIDAPADPKAQAREYARRRREARRAAGRCLDCGAPSPNAVRCSACRGKISVRGKHRTVQARIGRELEPRLVNAAVAGKGLLLSATDVERLAGAVKTAGITQGVLWGEQTGDQA